MPTTFKVGFVHGFDDLISALSLGGMRTSVDADTELLVLQCLDVHQCVGRGRITAVLQIFRLLKV